LLLNNKTTFLAIASRNPGKIEEIRLGLDGTSIKIQTIDDYPGFPEIEETEPDLAGNARLKSESLFAFSGVPSLADDTGLEVDALDGAPGVFSARFAGEQCSPVDNRALLLARLKGRPDRSARFRTVLAFTDRHGTRYFDGTCEGVILTEERGSGGFGYDSIFRPIESEKSFAELSPEEKNRLSHRGRALRKFFEFIRNHHFEA
jgi:XTP/dITP diphosphohydrolase